MHRSCSFRAYHFCFKFASAHSAFRSHARTTRPPSIYPSIIGTSMPDNSQAYLPCMSLSAGVSTSLFCPSQLSCTLRVQLGSGTRVLALPRRKTKVGCLGRTVHGPMSWGYLSRKLSLSCHRCSALLRYSQRGGAALICDYLSVYFKISTSLETTYVEHD